MAQSTSGGKTGSQTATKSSSFGETKTYIIILVIGILVIAALGYTSWVLIIQKFSAPPEELITSTEQTSPSSSNIGSSTSPFGFSSSPEETTPEPVTEDTTPTASTTLDEATPAVDAAAAPFEKAPATSKRPPQTSPPATTDQPQVDEKPVTSEPVAEVESKAPPYDEPKADTKEPEPLTTNPATRPAPPPVTQETSPGSADYPLIGRMPYSVLVHSFSDAGGESGLSRAHKATQDLNDKGYGAYWSKAYVKGNRWYRVLVGIFSTEREAINYARQLSQKLNVEATPLKLPYAVELGWQKSVPEANAVALKLARFQYSTYRWIVEKDGNRWVLLRTGAFGSKTEAEELLKLLNSDGFRGRVVER